MDIEIVMQLINTVGFPIVMCGVLYVQLNKIMDTHKGEIKDLSNIIENNTKAINDMAITVARLSERLTERDD